MQPHSIKAIAHLFHSATGIDTTAFDRTGQRIASVDNTPPTTGIINPLEMSSLINKLATAKAADCFHYVTTTKLEYLAANLISNAQITGIVIVGPFLTAALTPDDLNAILINQSLTVSDSHHLKQFYQGLPMLSTEKMTALGSLLVNLCHQAPISPTLVEVHDHQQIAVSRPVTSIHAASQAAIEKRYEEEQALMAAIAAGDKAGVKQQFAAIAKITDLFSSRIPGQPLRSTKNICFVYNTLCRIAAHRGGVQPVYLNDISEKYALLIERQTTLAGLRTLTATMALEYCELVIAVSTSGYQPMIKRTIDTILLNLGHAMSLSQLANQVGTNPSYLSRKFSEEVGMSVTDYMNRRRISEAKKYLARPTLSITEIAFMTGFNNVPYFIKVFKKLVGKTPLHYRNEVG